MGELESPRSFLDIFFPEDPAKHVMLLETLVVDENRFFADLRNRLTEVILTAPDIDAELFKQEIAPRLAAAGRPITLYASSEDRALSASRQIHGNSRAGESGRGLVVVPGVETVDATGMDTGFLRHSYFAEARSVLADLFFLIQEGRRPDERFGLRAVESAEGKYWAFK